jgi:hypothetical protein
MACPQICLSDLQVFARDADLESGEPLPSLEPVVRLRRTISNRRATQVHVWSPTAVSKSFHQRGTRLERYPASGIGNTRFAYKGAERSLVAAPCPRGGEL